MARELHQEDCLAQAELGAACGGVTAAAVAVKGIPVKLEGRPAEVVVGKVMGSVLPPVAGSVAPQLSVEEAIVLNYRSALRCFATLDLATTLVHIVSAIAIVSTSEAYEFYYWDLLGFVFLLGPISGIAGAKNLSRNLIGIYLAFCILKASWLIYIASVTFFTWPLMLAFLQFWITKVVGTCWSALGAISSERLTELRHGTEFQVQMVYW